ncbi:hypothetical protein Tco_0693309 [Tanacetum coccineum]
MSYPTSPDTAYQPVSRLYKYKFLNSVLGSLIAFGYEARVFESKGSGGGRGVKEKHSSMADKEKSGVEENLTTSGISLSTKSDDTMNEDTPVVVASAVKEIVTPSVLDMTVETKKRSSLEDTTVFGSFYISTQGTTTAGNAPVDSIRAISERFANTAYGFFIGKKGHVIYATNVKNT